MGFALTLLPFDLTSRWATSWILPPAILFTVRAAFALFTWFTVFFTLGWEGTHGLGNPGTSFSYFTDLTYWGIAGYALVSAVHTGTYWLRGREALKSWGKVLQILHEVLYSTITVFPWVVTIVYWALLYRGIGPFTNQYDTYSNVAQHALNSVFALIEIIFPRTAPLPWWHVIPVIIILALYLGLAYVTRATQGFYPYPFLDVAQNGSGVTTGYIFGILIGTCIVFAIVKFAIWARVWVTEGKLGFTGKRSSRDTNEATQDVNMESLASKEVRESV